MDDNCCEKKLDAMGSFYVTKPVRAEAEIGK